MSRYFSTNNTIVMNKAREIYAKSRLGFVIPCNLLIKVFPSLSGGVNVVGIFTKSNSAYLSKNIILADLKSGEILAVTESCYRNFGIHPAICYGSGSNVKKVILPQLFPLIKSMENLMEKNINFRDQILDSELIFTNHIYQKNNLSGIGSPEKKDLAFKKYPVKLELSETMTHGLDNFEVISIKFEEVAFIRNASARGGTLISEKNNNRPESEKKEGNYSSRSITIRSKKTIKSMSTERDVELSEAEIEEMNVKAEKERKLKEKKQMLKLNKMPFRIKLLYLVTTIALIICYGFHTFILIWKKKIGQYLNDSLVSFHYIKMREGLVPRIVVRTMMMDDVLT